MALTQEAQLQRDLQLVDFLSQIYVSSDMFHVIDQVVLLAALRTNASKLTLTQLGNAIEQHGLTLDLNLLEDALHRLQTSGQMLLTGDTPNQTYSLSEEAAATVNSIDEAFRMLETTLQHEWAIALHMAQPTLSIAAAVPICERLWPQAKTSLVAKALHALGRPAPPALISALPPDIETDHSQIQAALEVLGTLDHPLKHLYESAVEGAGWAWMTLSVDPTARNLLTSKWPRIEIWMDDNVVISALDVRERFPDDDTDELITLIKNNGIQKIDFCVHLRTMMSVNSTCEEALPHLRAHTPWTRETSLYDSHELTTHNPIVQQFHKRVASEPSFQQDDFIDILEHADVHVRKQGFLIHEDIGSDSKVHATMRTVMESWSVKTPPGRADHVCALLSNIVTRSASPESADKIIVLVTTSPNLQALCASSLQDAQLPILVLTTRQLYRALRKFLPNRSLAVEQQVPENAADFLSKAAGELAYIAAGATRNGTSGATYQASSEQSHTIKERLLVSLRRELESAASTVASDEWVPAVTPPSPEQSLANPDNIRLVHWFAASTETSMKQAKRVEELTKLAGERENQARALGERLRSAERDVDTFREECAEARTNETTQAKVIDRLNAQLHASDSDLDTANNRITALESSQTELVMQSRNAQSELNQRTREVRLFHFLAWIGSFALLLSSSFVEEDRKSWGIWLTAALIFLVVVGPHAAAWQLTRRIELSELQMKVVSWLALAAIPIAALLLWRRGSLDGHAAALTVLSIVIAILVNQVTPLGKKRT